jgi:anti-anti-sigma factor
LELRETWEGSVTVIAVKGPLDSAMSPALGPCLSRTLAGPDGRLLIELSQPAYIGSAGSRILLPATRRTAETRGQIVLAAVRSKVRELVHLAGFPEIFRIRTTRDEGAAALR